MTEYVKIENPDIFALKDDFENLRIYFSQSGCMCVASSLSVLFKCITGGESIYRNQHWTDKLDGTIENGVWCEVWHLEKPVKTIKLELITSFKKGHSYPYKGNDTWINAEPVPQAMVDFINRK